jgi:type VI protein secretion system component VasK
MVVIYGIVLIVGWKFVSPNSDSVFADLPLSGLERFFILLGMAALVHYMVRNVILTLTWLELPTTTGQPAESALAFLAPAIIVLAVLLLIILWMSYAISRRELELEDELEDDLEDEFEDELDDQPEDESEEDLEEDLEDELEEDEDEPTE